MIAFPVIVRFSITNQKTVYKNQEYILKNVLFFCFFTLFLLWIQFCSLANFEGNTIIFFIFSFLNIVLDWIFLYNRNCFQKANKSFSVLTFYFFVIAWSKRKDENYVRKCESWLQILNITQMHFVSYSHNHWNLYQRQFSNSYKLYSQHIHVLINLSTFILFYFLNFFFFGKMFKMYQRPQRLIVCVMNRCSNDYNNYLKFDMSDKYSLDFIFIQVWFQIHV